MILTLQPKAFSFLRIKFMHILMRDNVKFRYVIPISIAICIIHRFIFVRFYRLSKKKTLKEIKNGKGPMLLCTQHKSINDEC